MGAVSNFQVKNKNLFVFFSTYFTHFWRLIKERKVYHLAESKGEMYSSYTCFCSCGISFPRFSLMWSWSNNYLKIGFIISLLSGNQMFSVTLAGLRRKSDTTFSAAYSSVFFICCIWLVSETFPKGGILEANHQICWISNTWSQF